MQINVSHDPETGVIRLWVIDERGQKPGRA
jgi:hypothetical protein